MPTNHQEIEIKLRVAHRGALLRSLKRLRARCVAGRVHEMNVLFDTPRQTLRRRGEIIRVRVETPAAARVRGRTPWGRGPQPSVLLTFKGPPVKQKTKQSTTVLYKVRMEQEFRISSPPPLQRILRTAGLAPSFCYEKYRQTYRLPRLPGLLVQIDETPLGDFLELEGKPAQIDRAAALLGYAPSDYIVKGYGRLYEESLRRGRSGRMPLRRQTARKSKAQRQPARNPALPGMVFPRKRQLPAANIWNS